MARLSELRGIRMFRLILLALLVCPLIADASGPDTSVDATMGPENLTGLSSYQLVVKVGFLSDEAAASLKRGDKMRFNQLRARIDVVIGIIARRELENRAPDPLPLGPPFHLPR
jgi:hypothetical protein